MSSLPRLAVDIGGTFTDLVLDIPGREALSAKLLTTHAAPERAVLDGVAAILGQAGLAPAEIGLVIHGTTLATNALIERKGARTALLTTDGFRDSLEIAYEHRFEQYDLYMERPEPLVPRPWRFEVPERLAADGSVLLPLDEAALAALGPRLVEEGVEALAICFLHAYANPVHERRARELLAGWLRPEAICLSSEVCPEIREYDRASTTVANAYVLPLMERYLGALEAGLAALGCRAPLLMMMSSGGMTTLATARRFPIRLVESGPAGGAMLARLIAAQSGIEHALAFDMGGTTAKLTLIDDLAPQQARSFEVARAARFLKGSGIPLRIPVIDMVEIGAGGGSIARVDALGRLAVGPESAGADPGPACYGRGGRAATVTDADLLIGRIDPEGFAGGRISLDPAAARRAVETDVALPLRLGPEAAACGITEMVSEAMAAAARVHAAECGKETAGRTMIAFGGAAPLHAARLAQRLGISRIVVPRGAGVGSAHGFLAAPLSYEVVRSRLMSLAELDARALDALFAEMRAEAEAILAPAAPVASLEERRQAFMRYRGQGHEVAVPLPPGPYAGRDAGRLLRAGFEATYRALYGRLIPGLEVEALTWTLSLAEAKPLPARLPPLPPAPAPAAARQRRIIDPATGAVVEADVFDRAQLPPGARIRGPALVQEEATTTVIPPGFSAAHDAAGHLVLEAEAAA
ncbi:MAG: hydantoinase/oxoprolinase family protein [Rhodovarius sp.]|nr:hydantoinase/oxoprolinase family protein [Rhodovarius sp.]